MEDDDFDINLTNLKRADGTCGHPAISLTRNPHKCCLKTCQYMIAGNVKKSLKSAQSSLAKEMVEFMKETHIACAEENGVVWEEPPIDLN